MLNLISFLVGVAGLFLAYIFYRFGRKEKQLVYAYKNISIVGQPQIPHEDEITILFKGNEVKKITSTIISIWNAGKDPIKKTDIPGKNPLLISFNSNSNLQILRASIKAITRNAIEFDIRITDNKKEVIFSFDFLDYKDGATVEILHTGDEGMKPYFKGTILGMPKGINTMGAFLFDKPNFIIMFFNILTLIMATLFALFIVPKPYSNLDLVIVPLLIIFLSVMLFIQIIRLKKIYSLPSKLKFWIE